MSSNLTSQGMVLATAMAVSGTFILLTLRLQKSIPASFQYPVDQISPSSSPQILRPCLSSDGKRREKKKKRVRFAKDVVDPIGYSEEFRRQHGINTSCRSKFKKSSGHHVDVINNNNNDNNTHRNGGEVEVGTMPANRLALYNGIIRDRGVQRMAYPY